LTTHCTDPAAAGPMGRALPSLP